MDMNLDAMLTITQCALYLDKSERAIYKWVTKGKISHTKDRSGKTVIQLRDLLDVEATTKRGRPVGTPTRRGV